MEDAVFLEAKTNKLRGVLWTYSIMRKHVTGKDNHARKKLSIVVNRRRAKLNLWYIDSVKESQ